MGYHGDDRHGGGDRWRDRDERWGGGDWDRGREPMRGEQGRGGGWNEGRREASGWGSSSGGRADYREGSDNDRGFLQRAGEEVRSWFSGDHDPRYGGGRGEDRARDHSGGSYGWMSNGWGNQSGESWNRDRPGVSEREGWFTDSIGGERGRRPGGSPDYGRSGGSTSSHDPHYSEWRQRQIEQLDRDYEEYRREHQSKFENEFGGWRSKRQGQRTLLGKVTEHMEVVGSDGQHIGNVDAVRGDRIILTKADANAGGVHHSIPCSWVETVDERVTVNKTADEALHHWREEDRNRALFERPDQGSPGPHALNRSFSGTYRDE
jgi:hypothetical protein